MSMNTIEDYDYFLDQETSLNVKYCEVPQTDMNMILYVSISAYLFQNQTNIKLV